MNHCLICNKHVPLYEPVYCCDGYECNCGGYPVNPCICGGSCLNALLDHIGIPYNERRKAANLLKYDNERGCYEVTIGAVYRNATMHRVDLGCPGEIYGFDAVVT